MNLIFQHLAFQKFEGKKEILTSLVGKNHIVSVLKLIDLHDLIIWQSKQQFHPQKNSQISAQIKHAYMSC